MVDDILVDINTINQLIDKLTKFYNVDPKRHTSLRIKNEMSEIVLRSFNDLNISSSDLYKVAKKL